MIAFTFFFTALASLAAGEGSLMNGPTGPYEGSLSMEKHGISASMIVDLVFEPISLTAELVLTSSVLGVTNEFFRAEGAYAYDAESGLVGFSPKEPSSSNSFSIRYKASEDEIFFEVGEESAVLRPAILKGPEGLFKGSHMVGPAHILTDLRFLEDYKFTFRVANGAVQLWSTTGTYAYDRGSKKVLLMPFVNVETGSEWEVPTTTFEPKEKRLLIQAVFPVIGKVSGYMLHVDESENAEDLDKPLQPEGVYRGYATEVQLGITLTTAAEVDFQPSTRQMNMKVFTSMFGRRHLMLDFNAGYLFDSFNGEIAVKPEKHSLADALSVELSFLDGVVEVTFLDKSLKLELSKDGLLDFPDQGPQGTYQAVTKIEKFGLSLTLRTALDFSRNEEDRSFSLLIEGGDTKYAHVHGSFLYDAGAKRLLLLPSGNGPASVALELPSLSYDEMNDTVVAQVHLPGLGKVAQTLTKESQSRL